MGGNLDRREAVGLLRRMGGMLDGPGGCLIGIDLVKDIAVLQAAYDDAEGVTAAFNLNILSRINTELGGDFELDRFAHEARWNPVLNRIEMHLVSLAAQTVTLNGLSFGFAPGETIHTENSHKFTVRGFQDLARKAGFSPVKAWVHEQTPFSIHWLEVKSKA